MSDNLIQTSFAAGELSSSMFARTDLAKYHSGAATMRNFFVDYRSGASTRMGFKYVIQAYKSSTAVRLIPYQLSSVTTFVIEFGDFYARFHTNGGPVLETAFNIVGATQAQPTVINVPGHNFIVNDWVFVAGVQGMTALAGFFIVIGVAGNFVSLGNLDGTPANSILYPAYSGGGTVARIYTIASPYAAVDLALLKFAQISSSMTLTHPSYPPYTLVATAPTNWTFTLIVFGTTVAAPTGLVATPTTGGTANYAYVVTAIDANGQESQQSAQAGAASVNIGTTAGTIALGWNVVVGAVSYNIYKAELSYAGVIPSGAAFGFIGTSIINQFADSNIVPDFATTPPIANNPFAAGNDPSCNCFFQQRAYFAGSNSFPTTFWASQPGLYKNFDKSDPIQADDSIEGTLVSVQVNTIKSMLPMPGGLILLTSAGAWQLSSGSGVAATSAVTPINATASPQAYNGASDLPPIPINYDILFVQSKGSIVRDLAYNIYANIYTGNDISVLSNHLFYGHTLTEWAYAEEPFRIVWAVRDDGILLSLTYVKEQEIYGWARHDTLGLFKSVCSVREGNLDSVYVVVQRQIGGRWIKSIERLADRTFPYGAEDAFCVDCGSSTSLTFPVAGLTADVSSGTVNFTADANIFSPANVGSILRMDGGIATITSFVSANQLVGLWTQNPTTTLPNSNPLVPLPANSGDWSLTVPFTTVSGLEYLNGQTVSILADGGVVAAQVVANGQITLASPATKVHVGLGFTPQLQTMYLDTGEPTIQGKRKNINALTVRAVDTRGILAGSSFSTLVPIKQLSSLIGLGSPIRLQTGDQRVVMDPSWTVQGQICLQVNDPVPATVLGVIPEISVGDTR